MKNKFFLGMLFAGLLFTSACGKESVSKSEIGEDTKMVKAEGADVVEEDEINEEKKSAKNVEVSMETLKSYEVSPASDFEWEGTALIKYIGNEDIVVIPESVDGVTVKLINKDAFIGSDIKAVKIPDSVNEIGAMAFSDCSELEYVICGSGVLRIRVHAFKGCTALKELVLNEGLQYLESGAISGTGLKEIYIPDSVINMKDSIYYQDEMLVVKGKSGSVAEEYANDCEFIEFVAVE